MNALKVIFGGKCWKHFRNDDQIDIGECCARRAAMNAILILSCATALLAQSQTCTTTAPCSLSTNVPYDSAGTPDMRPGTWGNAASGSLSIPFLGVPAGYQVRITRVYGDVVAWPHGAIVPGAFSGILSGLTNTTPNQSAFVPSGLGNAGCFMYFQDRVGANGSRIPIDVPNIKNGLLNADNVVILKQAVWLNETGASIHMETTLVIEFVFEAPMNFRSVIRDLAKVESPTL